MSTLEEIKIEYCKEQGNEENPIDFKYMGFSNTDLDIIAQRFASQQVKEALERAAEKVEILEYDSEGELINYYKSTQFPGVRIEINKSSILSLIKEY